MVSALALEFEFCIDFINSDVTEIVNTTEESVESLQPFDLLNDDWPDLLDNFPYRTQMQVSPTSEEMKEDLQESTRSTK